MRAIIPLLVIFLSLIPAGCGHDLPDREDVAQAAEELSQSAEELAQDVADTQDRGRRVATAVAEATGVSISPLAGMVIIAVADWFRTESGQEPWYASAWFLIPAIVLLILVAFKDTLGELFGPLKKPLDMLDELLHIAAGVLAMAMVIPEITAAVRDALPEPEAAQAVTSSAHAMLASRASMNWGLVLDMAVYSLAGFMSLLALGAVWLMSNAVNVLTIILPAPFVGLLLKCIRLGTAGILALATLIHPVLGMALAAMIILVAWKLCGWSFRLLVMGLTFSFEFLTLRWKRFSTLGSPQIWAFAARKLGKRTPKRTLGVLLRREGNLEFLYRPWLVLNTRRLILDAMPGDLVAAKAHLNPSILALDAQDQRPAKLFNLPPRYKTHEDFVASRLGLPREIMDISLLKKVGNAGRRIRDAFRAEAKGMDDLSESSAPTPQQG